MMKKILTIISICTAVIATSTVGAAYNPSNLEKSVAEKLAGRIIQVSEEKCPLYMSSCRAQDYADNILKLVESLKTHPKIDETTANIFDLIIQNVQSHYQEPLSNDIQTETGAMQEDAETESGEVTEEVVIDPLAQIKEEMLAAVNSERAKQGKTALTLNDQLNSAAQKHAEYMNTAGDFAHTTKAGLTFDQRIMNEGYVFMFAGENIAYGQNTVGHVMQTWMNSPGHKANILDGNFTEIGIGHSGIYRVQDFGKPMK